MRIQQPGNVLLYVETVSYLALKKVVMMAIQLIMMVVHQFVRFRQVSNVQVTLLNVPLQAMLLWVFTIKKCKISQWHATQLNLTF